MRTSVAVAIWNTFHDYVYEKHTGDMKEARRVCSDTIIGTKRALDVSNDKDVSVE